jgi:putative FmdB family regulatory protein
MPTYVYECSKCNDVFEVDQRITENPLDECHCGSKGTVKRLIQPVGVMFKGDGFHINDYASSTSPAKDKETKTEEKAAPASPPEPAPAASPASDAME